MNNATTVQQALQLVSSGQRAAAVTALSALLAQAPAIGDEWLRVAHAALAIGELTLADTAARHFLVVDRNQVSRAVQCAGVIAETGNLKKAFRLAEPYARRHPKDPALNHLCGTLCQQMGELREANKYLRAALHGANLSGVTWLTLAAQHKFVRDDALLSSLQQLGVAFARTEAFNQVQYHFALGKALLDLQQYDEAFDAFGCGAGLAPDAALYDAAREAGEIDALIASFSATGQNDAGDSNTRDRAIFLVGLPRSGTTLLQRILCAHKDVTGGGEFAGMGVATLDYRKAGSIDAAGIMDIREIYSHLGKMRFGARGLFVDKSINNSYYVDTIAKAFPHAPIIFLQRNVQDLAWSCFRTCFSKGQHWSWKPADITAHITIQQRLMNHWKSVLADRITVVQYEDLVQRPEQVLPELFARCGLTFNRNVLNFYRLHSPVATASVAQVTQPLNTRSVGSAACVAHRMSDFKIS